MIEFTEEEEIEIQKRVAEAKDLERWMNAEDTIRRLIIANVKQQVTAGLLHPFHNQVAETMVSGAILREPVRQSTENPKDEPAEPEEN